MIELLAGLLREAGFSAGFFRLTEFLTFRIMMAALTALLVELLLGHLIIVGLYRRFKDMGGDYLSLQSDDKRGTPTAGGILILVGVLVSLGLWGRWTSYYLIGPTVAFVYFALVGLFDDWLKMRLKSSLFGLGQVAKTVLQIVFIVPSSWWLVSPASPLPPAIRSTVFLPFAKDVSWNPGPLLFGAFVTLSFYLIVNAVNITDGMDGLATGPSLLVAGLYGAFAYVLGNSIISGYLLFPHQPGAGELTVFAAALVGGLAGFLWFNAYPSEIFMGDTGSMSVGAALASLAFLTKQELLFPIAGGVFVASITTSFVQQKIGDKIGRRIVLRAPIHHGWNYRGIAEPKVVIRYWIVSGVLAIIAALSLKLR